MDTAIITIGIDPMIRLGPITLAWHGVTIAAGVLLGGLFAGREARRRGLDPERLQAMARSSSPEGWSAPGSSTS